MAVRGSSSEIRTPGTLVSIDRNGPPVSVLGLGSQVSSWLAPPASQITSTCRSFLASSAAIAGLVKLASPVRPSARARGGLPPRNRRRDRDGPSNCRRRSNAWRISRGLNSMVEPKFRRGEQGPGQLAEGVGPFLGSAWRVRLAR